MRPLLLALLAAAGCTSLEYSREAEIRKAQALPDPEARVAAVAEVRRADSLQALPARSPEDAAWLRGYARRTGLEVRGASTALAVPAWLRVTHTETVVAGRESWTELYTAVHGEDATTGRHWVYVFDSGGRLWRSYEVTPAED